MNTPKQNNYSISVIGKRITIIALVLFMSGFVFGQNHSIKGRVMSAKTNETCPFATCALYNIKDTTRIVAGSQTNEKGEFSISKLKKVSYLLKISYVGFEKKSIRIQAEQLTQNALDLGDIALAEAKSSLGDVVITAQKDKIKLDADKLSVTIDENTAAASTNVFELLKKTPQVSIDNQDNLTLNGKSGVLIQFSGRDMRLPWKQMVQLLKGMPSASVERFEIITNPSAKYDAEGIGGIINIVFKQNKTNGFNASVGSDNSFSKKNFFGSQDLSLAYANDKITTFLSFSAGEYFKKGSSFLEVKNWVFGDTIMLRTNQDSKFRYYSYNLNTGVDYQFNKTSSVGFNFTYSRTYMPPISNHSDMIVSTYPYDWSAPDSSMYGTSSSKQTSDNYLINLNYQKKFDTLGRKIELNLDLGINSSNNFDNNTSLYYHGTLSDGYLTSQQAIENNTKNTYNTYSLRADYTHPFSKTLSLESGAKTALTDVDNKFASAYNGINLVGVSNNFLYKENINAIYSSLSKQFDDKTSLRLGLRVENTNIKGEQKMMPDSNFTQSYASFFPNVTISHKFTQMNTLNFNYNLRISRPTYDNLNPFLAKTNEYTYSVGNPHLKAQYTHTLSLQSSLFYVFFTNLTYSYTKNMIAQIPIASQTALAASFIPSNIASAQNLNLSFSTALPVSSWLTVIGYFSLNHSYNKLEYAQGVKETNVNSYTGYFSSNFNLPYKFKFSASGFYVSGGTFGLYEYKSVYGVNLDLNRNFFKDLLTLNVGVNNLFMKSTMEVTYKYGAMDIYTKSAEMSGAMFHIGLKLNIGSSNTNTELNHKKDEFDNRASGERSTGGGIGK